MIDIFALSIAHGLLVLAALRLIARDELDREGEPRRRFGSRRMVPRNPAADAISARESDRP